MPKDEMPKIGCVQHDCDACKNQQAMLNKLKLDVWDWFMGGMAIGLIFAAIIVFIGGSHV
jgi:hypothetical protein